MVKLDGDADGINRGSIPRVHQRRMNQVRTALEDGRLPERLLFSLLFRRRFFFSGRFREELAVDLHAHPVVLARFVGVEWKISDADHF